MAIEDLLDEVGGGVAGFQGESEDLATGGFNFFTAGDEVGPISALDEDIGQDGGDEIAGGVFIEESDGIDGGQGEGDAGACLFVADGTGGALEPLDARVCVEGEDQNIAESAGGFEQADMTGMEEVVAAIGEDDAFALVLPDGALRQEAGTRVDLGHGYTFSL